MKRKIIRYEARRLDKQEKQSGYRFPGKIVAAAEWRGTKKGSFGTAIPQEPK